MNEDSKIFKVEKVNCASDCCDNRGKLLCSGCRQVKYCSRDCQAKEWTNHKKDCKIMETKKDPKEIDDVAKKEPQEIEIVNCAATGCNDLGKLLCSRCRLVKYCSASCQGKEWKNHKKDCKIIGTVPRAQDKKKLGIVNIHALARARLLEKLDLELQANPSRIDEHEPINKATVLHIAAESGNLSMVQMLVTKYDASMTERGGSGKFTALCYAVVQPEDDYTGLPIYPMAEATRTSIVKFLLEHGASPNISGLVLKIGPMDWAAMNQFQGIIELLVEHGADVNAKNSCGDTCLDSLYNIEKPKVIFQFS